MRIALRMVAVVFLVSTLTTPFFASANTGEQGFFCDWFGWMVRPFGGCAQSVAVATPIQHLDEPNPDPVVLGESVTQKDPELATSTYPVTYETITNEYVTIQQSGVSESLLNQRITEVLQYINSLPHSAAIATADGVQATSSLSTRDYVLKSVDRIYERVDAVQQDIFVQAELTTPTLADAILSGTSYVTGRLGIGTSSPADSLSLAGALYLAEVSPSNVVNRLYNFGGDLYWGGVVLAGSSTANWSAVSGDVFRLTGNVGIGTSTPSETLTVAGTLSAGTTTARLVDTGGQVCNVEAYGAVGDNSTINDAAIASAIAACGEGGTVYFPMGEYRISSPIVLDTPVTLRGAYSPRWSYSSTPRSSIRADFGTFSGAALIHVRDRTISGETNHNNGGRLEYLSLDGGSASVDVDGVYFEGLVRDWKLTDVDISQVTGNGFEAAVGTGSGNPRGFTIRGLSIYSADGHGFRATALNDSYIEDLLAVGNALRGIYLSSMGETKINNSRAVFNGLTGLYIDGSSSNGGMMFTDFSTDRNDRHGVRISLTGTTTVTFNGLLTRRDGPNSSGGTETPYAGVAIIGSSTAQVAPVFINGLSQIIGEDDSSNPPVAPLTGVRVSNASYVKVEGQLWGMNEAYSDDGGNDNFIIEEGSIVKVGEDGVTETPPPLYHNKWVASSTIGGLIYDGQINIGSSTDSRLLNIVAPAGAGARFRDTTNDVIFDMRAEDFQGFFGTFSNHQLRFQTNNTSRLTIDTNGYVGIGTTSPTAMLTVASGVRFAGIVGGTLETDAVGNVTVSSDERLKNILGAYEAGLDEILSIRPIRYSWNEKSGYDQTTIYAGFSAQNIEDFLPEAVGENPDGYKTLSTRPILAAVVTAIQEIWQTVTGNQQRIAELEERLAEVEAELGVEQQPVEEDDEDKVVEPVGVLPTDEETATTSAAGTEEVLEDTSTTTDEVIEDDEEVSGDSEDEAVSDEQEEVIEEEVPNEPLPADEVSAEETANENPEEVVESPPNE